MKQGSRVFVSGPIHGVEEEQGYRETLSRILTEHGFAVLDPWKREKALYPSTERRWWKNVPCEWFIKRDLEDVEKCDLLVAYLPSVSPGSCMELFYARLKGKKTVVIHQLKDPSPWILFHADYVFKSINEFEKFIATHQL